MAQLTRTTQCLKFSCYELCKFETSIYVCQIVFLVTDNWSTTCSMRNYITSWPTGAQYTGI